MTILSRPTNTELDNNAKAYFIIHKKYVIQVTENYDLQKLKATCTTDYLVFMFIP